MMYFGNMSGWGIGFMWISGLVIMGLFIWFVITLLNRTSNPSSFQYPHHENSLDILKKRYAGGEITKEDFDRMSKDLS